MGGHAVIERMPPSLTMRADLAWIDLSDHENLENAFSRPWLDEGEEEE